MFSCDYNGWADVPEEEREAIDAYELEQTGPAVLPAPKLAFKPLMQSPQGRFQRRAA
jgi:hypothetical protein